MTTGHRFAVVGIGNPLAGDDGAGLEALKRLKERMGVLSGVLFLLLEGDLFEIGEHLHRAERFLFIDAIAGDSPGEIVTGSQLPRALAPSFHQTDIGAVMGCLRHLDCCAPFPEWEIWGITIDPPATIGYGLSPEVASGVGKMVDLLHERLAVTQPDTRHEFGNHFIW